MPEIGKPINYQERAFQNVQMAPRHNEKVDPNQYVNDKRRISDREKERFMNKISGYKKKNDLIVDASEHNKMGKNEFLKLLTVQLNNQDPTNPVKQEKMAAELAQFSQLEQLTNLNSKFDQLTKNQQVEDKFYGASFLGKEVVTSGSSLKFEGEGSSADILFTLPKAANKVLVRLYDGNNNMVGEIWQENVGRGNQTLTWDGMQLDNSISGAGEFRTQVFAWDQFADPIEVKTKSTGLVESVFFENGETVLKVGGKKVFLRDVDSFHTPGKNEKQSQRLAQKLAKPSVNAGRPMASQFKASENNAAKKLPIAKNIQASVNLNKINTQQGVSAYKEQAPSTGITSVYDN